MGLDKWTATKPDPMAKLAYHAVAYGNDEFVVVGPRSIVRSRNEGASWLNDSTQLTEWYHSVSYGGGVFVAVGIYQTRWNGFMWSSPISQTVGGVTKHLRAVAHGEVPLGGPGAPKSFGLFVAVGDAGSIVTSRDGVTWATSNSGITDDLKTIAYGNQRFVAAADSGKVFTSPNGVTWTHVASTASYFRALTFGHNIFVGVLNSKVALKSSDGASWTNLSTGLANADPMSSIDCGFDTFVVVGANGSIHTSPDGIVWTKRLSGATTTCPWSRRMPRLSVHRAAAA